VVLRRERAVRTGEDAAWPHAQNVAYTAVLGDVEQFRPARWVLAVRHDVPAAKQSRVTADGAEWIGNVADAYFPDSAQLVDGFHATPHLADAAQALFPDPPARAHAGFKARQDDLC
jgi:hypothetical protein